MSFDHYNNNFNDVDLLVVTGEHSGDELGSCLVSSLIKNNQDLNIVCKS